MADRSGADPNSASLRALTSEIVECRRCPRLVAWREQVAAEKRSSFAGETYWGRPVPGFGDSAAWLCVVGLAPAAHGGNRTGRVFTGDRSGDWLYAAMWRAGLANQPQSVSLDDGLQLSGAYVSAAVRCAPPQNRPTPEEFSNCLGFLKRELALLGELKVVLVLGELAYRTVCGIYEVKPRPKFAHGVRVRAPEGVWIIASYHPSQQNTFTGKLTEPMLDSVFEAARTLAASLTTP
ncbi:MAG: uracil-DNA glycosylase [Acidimicrobiales bacterium]